MLCCALWAGCKRGAEGGGPQSKDGWSPEQVRKITQLSPPHPQPVIDETNRVVGDAQAARLGQQLFFDASLSKDGTVSCATCHDPATAFSVPTAQGLGLGGTPTLRHPPTLLNAAYHRWFDWDGKADSLWSQAIRPLEGAGEHGMDRVSMIRKLSQDARYRSAYEEVFGEVLPTQVNAWPNEATPTGSPEQQMAWEGMPGELQAQINRAFVNALKALAAYQSRLISFESRFDRYVRALRQPGPLPKEARLSPQERRGLKVFLGKGRCVVCHNGPLLSDMAFHNLGLPGTDAQDEGRWAGVMELRRGELGAGERHSDDPEGERAAWSRFLKQTPEDRGQFKTPGLRNLAHSSPYMHRGQFKTLGEVIAFYNHLPGDAAVGHREDALRPLGLSPQEMQDLESWLGTLTLDPLPQSLLHPPPW